VQQQQDPVPLFSLGAGCGKQVVHVETKYHNRSCFMREKLRQRSKRNETHKEASNGRKNPPPRAASKVELAVLVVELVVFSILS